MRFIVLGSAAGGGLPQWNCGCLNCRLARAGDPRIPCRTQASLAVSGDGECWTVIAASPDLRQQMQATPELHPQTGVRHSPIANVVVPGAEIDQITGLLTLRESHRFTLWATAPTLAILSAPLFNVLRPSVVSRETIALGQPFGTGDGFAITAFAVPGKAPLYLESEGNEGSGLGLGQETEETIGLEILEAGRRHYFIQSCAYITEALRTRIDGAATLIFDGTTHDDDEMIRLGLSAKTAWRMGHIPMGGAGGSVARLADLRIGRRIFIHINNSNPVLRSDSAERAAVERAGWEISYDGMRFEA